LLYAAASALCAAAPSLDWLIVGRVGQALGACAGVTIARAVVADRYPPTEAARLFSLLFLVLGVAPMLAPTVGALLLEAFGWRAIFLVLAGFGLMLFVAVWRGLPESRTALAARTAENESVVASYLSVLRNRRLAGFVLTGAGNGAALFTYVSSSSTLFIGHFGVTPTQFGWIFALNAAGLIVASQVNRWVLKRAPPERIMVFGSLGATLAGGVLVLLGATGWGGLAGMMAGIFVALSSYGFVSSNAMALALGVDRARAGAISAVMGATSFAVGAAASAIVAAIGSGSPLVVTAVIAAGFFASSLALYGLARVRP
jgi:DHA1 family bicyclomycin/chloramphenicol resistance-like MFS transporter